MATVSYLKKKLDNIFSQYIRLKEADEYGYVYCCTCKQRFFWKDVDCGHFIHRSANSTRYDERNVAPQCRACNRGGNRNASYILYLTGKYGNDIIRQLAKLECTTKRWSEEELRDLIKTYTEKVKCLKNEKGITV